MPENLDQTLTTLQKMLSTEEGQQSLRSLASAFLGGGPAQNNELEGIAETEADYPIATESPNLGNLGNIDPGLIVKVTGALSAIQSTDGPSFRLLYSLQPFLNIKRQEKFETALRIAQLSKLPQIRQMF